MRYVARVSGDRVAEVMGVKVQSVYVALARIHRALRDCIRARHLRRGRGIRVQQKNGELAWTSPMWIRRRG